MVYVYTLLGVNDEIEGHIISELVGQFPIISDDKGNIISTTEEISGYLDSKNYSYTCTVLTY